MMVKTPPLSLSLVSITESRLITLNQTWVWTTVSQLGPKIRSWVWWFHTEHDKCPVSVLGNEPIVLTSPSQAKRWRSTRDREDIRGFFKLLSHLGSGHFWLNDCNFMAWFVIIIYVPQLKKSRKCMGSIMAPFLLNISASHTSEPVCT